MRQALRLHPDSRRGAVTAIEGEVVRPCPANLLLRYFVTGKINDLSLPPVAVPARGDELWRHTCFEAFVRAPPSAAYYEFNFAPSLQWAAYRFSDYRNGMRVAGKMSTPRVEAQSDGACYRLQASLALDRLPGLPRDAPWRLGLSAVIEDASGHRSYWSLAHPPGKADFHHPDCFAHELPVAERL